MPSASERRYLERAAEAYAGQLYVKSPGIEPVIAYLREHAIDQGIAVRYALGFVGEPLPGDERFTGMLSIPYLSPGGVTAIKFRDIGGVGGKYAKHNGSKNRLYNSAAYFSGSSVIGIAEGEMDAIAATEHLGIPSLGVPGVESWKDFWLPLLKDFTRVLIFGDGDQKGREFSARIAESVGWRGRVVSIPEGEDISSLATAGTLSQLATKFQEDEDE